MLACLLVLTFFTVVATGPTGLEWIEKRKQKKNQALAKIIPFPYPPRHPKKL